MATKAKYSFINFLQQRSPYPHSIEQSFGVLAWMIRTGQRYSNPGKWGVQTIESLISRNCSVTNMYEIEPITDLKTVFRYLHNAILSTAAYGNLQTWRDDHGINAYSSKIIAFNHAKPFDDEKSEAAIEAALNGLFGAKGRLKTQLNEHHSRAKEVYGVRMHFHHRSPGWRFVLHYGFDGSIWEEIIARQRPNERLLPVIQRASEKLHEYMTVEKSKKPRWEL